MTERYEPRSIESISDRRTAYYDRFFESAFTGRPVRIIDKHEYKPIDFASIIGSIKPKPEYDSTDSSFFLKKESPPKYPKPKYYEEPLSSSEIDIDSIMEHDSLKPFDFESTYKPAETDSSAKVEESQPVDDEKTERERIFHEKYPNACRLIKAELAKKGKYDSEYSFAKPIEQISVADLTESTLKYLEDWESLEFGSNSPNLKPAILREIILKDYIFIAGAKENEDFIFHLKEMGKSLDEFVADLQIYVEKVTSESQLFRATDLNVLVRHILSEDERWKSQFETRTSGGNLNPSLRSKREEHCFGFPDYSSDPAKITDESSPYHVSKRPIYGYFSPDKNGILNDSGTQPPPNTTRQYGKVHCKVRQSKYSETTASFGDSLYGGYALTPFTKPHYTSLELSTYNPKGQYEKMFDFNGSEGRVVKKINVVNLYRILSRYTETQIHNGLRMEDIESIHISFGNGVDDYDINELKFAVDKYNSRHPDSQIKLIEY